MTPVEPGLREALVEVIRTWDRAIEMDRSRAAGQLWSREGTTKALQERSAAIEQARAALAAAPQPALDVERLARAIASLAHGKCCWDATEDSRDLAAEYERLGGEG